MELTMNRMAHSLAVGRKMSRIASKLPGIVNATPDEMFLLGYLHDIGYEISSVQENHASDGGELLRGQGYKYWREVYYHGFMQEEYQSPELVLLNYADMTTGPTGVYLTTDERIADIRER